MEHRLESYYKNPLKTYNFTIEEMRYLHKEMVQHSYRHMFCRNKSFELPSNYKSDVKFIWTCHAKVSQIRKTY